MNKCFFLVGGNNSRQLSGIDEDELIDSPRRYMDSSSQRLPPTTGRGLTEHQLHRHNQMHGDSRGRGASGSEAGYTTASNRSVAESIISRASARKGKF